MTKFLPILSCATLLCGGAALAVQPSPLFSDHAVLQAGRPVPVWGSGDSGEKVIVRFGKVSAETVADASGRWRVELPPLSVGETGELVFEGNNRVVSRDVLAGDVWLCAGQSNMDWYLNRCADAEKEVAAADHPQMRYFNVTHTSLDKPTAELKGEWVVCSPDKAGEFSGVGYFFATCLIEKLHKPVGLIDVSWGASPIETWLSAEAVDSKPEVAVVRERWTKYLTEEYPVLKRDYDRRLAEWKTRQKEARAKGIPFIENPLKAPDAPDTQKALSGGFNGVVNPVIPYALKGILWYQGEHNTMTNPTEYALLLETLISDWRSKWGDKSLPFLYVQLANYRGSGSKPRNWAIVREQQQQVLKVPHTGMAAAIDVGDPVCVHPVNKREVGRRLSLLAFDKVYGLPMLTSGPVFQKQIIEGGKVRLKFETFKSPPVLRQPAVEGPSFEISGADRVFHPAEAVLDGEDVVVSSPEVSAPVSVRYLWFNTPAAVLFNKDGLPAFPFRTDDWPEAQRVH